MNREMHLINRLFNDITIRTVWNKEHGKYFVNIRVISNSNDKQIWRNKNQAGT